MATLQNIVAAIHSADEQIGLLYHKLIYIWDNEELYKFLNQTDDLTQVELDLCKGMIPDHNNPEILLETLKTTYKLLNT